MCEQTGNEELNEVPPLKSKQKYKSRGSCTVDDSSVTLIQILY